MFKKSFYLTLIIVIIATAISMWRHTGAQSAKKDFILTWHTDSYTPLEYKGKKLASQKSNITVVATPTSNDTDWQNMNYNWFQEDLPTEKSFMVSASGKGKNYLTFSPNSSSPRIKVYIYNDKKTFEFTQTISIKIIEPEIIFYPLDDTNKLNIVGALKNFEPFYMSPGSSKYVAAVPYFVNNKNISQLAYKWIFNNEELGNENPPNFFNIQIENKLITNQIIKLVQVVVDGISSTLKVVILPQ